MTPTGGEAARSGFPSKVKIVEVGARDGLQNEAAPVPTQAKVELIERLAEAGITSIEAGSVVSPKWVPQMADTADVLQRLRRKSGVAYPVLVPNMEGLEQALATKCREVSIFAAASEAFSQKNINCVLLDARLGYRDRSQHADIDGRRRFYLLTNQQEKRLTRCQRICANPDVIPLKPSIGLRLSRKNSMHF